MTDKENQPARSAGENQPSKTGKTAADKKTDNQMCVGGVCFPKDLQRLANDTEEKGT